jgi:hypothetical protein
MTVHCVKVLAEHPAGVTLQQAQDAVQQWLDQHTRTVEDEEVPLFVRDEQGSSAPPHFEGTYRFTLDSTRSTLLDEIENVLQQVVDWYIVAYHGCTHDEDGGGDCTWNERREWGTVPTEVQV